MDMRKLLGALAIAACLAWTAACNNGGVTLVSPDQVTTTDTFSANVAQGGTNAFSFTTKAPGQITITLTSDATADGTAIPLQVGIGTTTAADGSCNVLSTAQTVLQLGTAFTSAQITTSGFGPFCVAVTDVTGAGPVSYTIQVTHL